VQEHAAQFLFEKLDLPADGRLRNMEPLARPGKAPLLRHRLKHLQLPNIHKLFPNSMAFIRMLHSDGISKKDSLHDNIQFYL
jgi:hypothetical protein